MTVIDPTARIERGAQLGRDVSIGPYCVIGPKVSIGDGCQLSSHVLVTGRTTIGARTRISGFVSLGTAPQSVHYHGEDTALSIGADCDLREHVTMNVATAEGRGVTSVGDHCFFMVGAHVGHDCVVGQHVTFANNATLGGFAEIGDYVFLGGLSAVHQFTRVGEYAIVGGLAGVTLDVIPYAAVVGHRGELAGLNRIGLKRRGFSTAKIQNIYRAYRSIFFGTGTFADRVAKVADESAGDDLVMRMVEFIRAGKARRLMHARDKSADDSD
jgi:UDP-N-acetylglucosamine acyltransferase